MTRALVIVCLVLSGSPSAYPEALTRPLLAKVEFTWPRPQAFSKKWAESSRDDVGRTLLKLTGEADGWYVVSKTSSERGRYLLERVVGERDFVYVDSIEGEQLTGWGWDREQKKQLTVAERLEGTVTQDALVSVTYARTLLAANGPLYTENPDVVGADSLRTTIARLGKEKPEALTAWAKTNKHDDALFNRLRGYRPTGTCSMDTHPQTAARVFAELAYARGDLGRFLQLRVLIMGDRFERTAWSSYGEQAHDTEVERLVSTGIDLERFILGLGIATQSEGPELNAWRQARAIQEAGLEKTMLPKLELLATSASLDAYNRLRATQAWFFVQVREQRGDKTSNETRAAVLERAAGLDLHPLAREWLQR